MDARSARPKGIALTERQRIAWLRLIRSDNVGPATFRDLINHFGSAEAALAMLPELSARGGATRAIRIASEAEAHRKLEIAHKFGARFRLMIPTAPASPTPSARRRWRSTISSGTLACPHPPSIWCCWNWISPEGCIGTRVVSSPLR
jgi:predicted Rossmann fold nucleotide-binding protein DprA/Smf involved in DNA uptake